MKYTQEELKRKNFAELKKIGDELNVSPEGDRRLRRNWIRAIEQAAEQAGDRAADEFFAPKEVNAAEVEPEMSCQSAIVPAAKKSPGVEPVSELDSKFGRIVYPRPAAKVEQAMSKSAIVPAATKSLDVEVDRVPLLTNADAWNPADFGDVLHKAEASGQLNLLEWDVSEPPDPDNYQGDMFAFQAAYDRWLLTNELHEIIYAKNLPGITQAPEPIAQNAITTPEIPRNESADVHYGLSHPAQPDGNYICTETAGLGNQEGDRVLEVPGNSQTERGSVIPHQPTQLSQSQAPRLTLQAPKLTPQAAQSSPGVGVDLKIGTLVGRRRDQQHLGKILAIYKSRRGIWRAKIQPLNKSSFVYFDCAALIEQRLLYDYEMKPGGFLPSGSTFDKTRGEKFEVYSRKVRSPKPTNWTAGELSSLSIFKLKQIARDMEILTIPGTAGKSSLIRAILAEQAISQEKAAAQLERETGRAIVQKQKFGPTAGKKKRASASPLGAQLSLFDVAV